MVARFPFDAMTDVHRPFCYSCGRPALACVCATVPSVDNRTAIYLLQHPRERFHPFGSVRLARLGLRHLALDIYGEAFAHQRTWSPLAPPGAALLYPGAHACELGSLEPAERPTSLVVIDGTWSQAKSMLKASPWLQALPQVKLRPPSPGLYRIRREPALDCMSTIEAIIEALRVLEPDTAGLDALLAAFTGMIDGHLELRAQQPHAPYRHARRARTAPSLAPALQQRLAQSLVIHAEFLRAESTTLLYWAGVRLRDGSSFGVYLRPQDAVVDDFHLARMGLRRQDLTAGVSLAALQQSWEAFVKPDDVVAAWSQSALDLLREQLNDTTHRTLHLKGVYCNLRHRGCGELPDEARAHGLAPEPTPFAGRAAERVGYALAMTRAMLDGHPALVTS